VVDLLSGHAIVYIIFFMFVLDDKIISLPMQAHWLITAYGTTVELSVVSYLELMHYRLPQQPAYP